jgi:hypothetical protein
VRAPRCWPADNRPQPTDSLIQIAGLQFAAGQFPTDRMSTGGRNKPARSRVDDFTNSKMTCNGFPPRIIGVLFLLRWLFVTTRDVTNPSTVAAPRFNRSR